MLDFKCMFCSFAFKRCSHGCFIEDQRDAAVVFYYLLCGFNVGKTWFGAKQRHLSTISAVWETEQSFEQDKVEKYRSCHQLW